jgi:hypothetical protein
MPNSYPAECPVDANSVSCHHIGSEPIAFAPMAPQQSHVLGFMEPTGRVLYPFYYIYIFISIGAALLYSGNCLGELSEC